MSKFKPELTWNQIEWGNSYKIVRRSQRRIFKASKLGDIRTVRQLQQRLIRSSHAKLIAVQQVTTLNKGNNISGVDGFIPTNSSMKLTLAKNLRLNGKASFIRRSWIPKPGKTTEKRPLGISTIQDRSKQALAKLALEPEWEAKFEPNSYGFRPGRSCHDAIEAIFLCLHNKTDKLVYDADIKKCFDKIDHKALIAKLNTFPLMEKQITAWLQAGIMEEHANTPKSSTMGTLQGGIILPLLSNIALHGLEEHLKNYVSTRDFPKPHPDASRGTRTKKSALGVIRYADDFVIIHRNPEIMEKVILETKAWLATVGLEISPEKTKLRKASQSFTFLGFQITLVMKQEKYRVKITPSKESVKRLTDKTHNIIQNNKSASSYGLICLLRPILIGWGNYFQYCECKATFKKVDNVIYNQIRAWVFRRATRQGRETVKQKYFPENRVYKFQNRTYKANWVLTGTRTLKGGKPSTVHLPKVAWISSKNYVKVKETASAYDGNHIYWANRCPRYSNLSTRVCNLLKRQKGNCNACKKKFQMGDITEVDQIKPRSQGGLDQYNNLQLLHRQCHVNKTSIDLRSGPGNLAGAG
uniref:Putative intron-encoded reverse transcriptase n=1 Tax=Seminavis robusta TaxID=568900 RepID=A0A3S8PZF3_9STRA|nr:putative intron-encoded reverse transcriptase [Seminavis robusta]|eukprot:Sro51_chlor_g030220.1 n/a (583) ;mRNA; f:97430-99178